MIRTFACVGLAVVLAACGSAALGTGGSTETAGTYRAWVTSESADEISLVEFGPNGGSVVLTRAVGSMPVEIDGPHGVAAGPAGDFIYVSIGHGVPFGSLWKIDTGSLEVLERTPLGLFPATVAVTPDGNFAFVSNFNLHGDPVPSSISKVHLPTMAEVARTETCVRPHGSRVNDAGTRHYSVCVTDQLLVEIEVATGEVRRMFSLMPDHLGDWPAGQAVPVVANGSACGPTWAEPAVGGSSVFVTCNRSAEVYEIDTATWSVKSIFPTGDAPYNLAVTPDGRYLLVSLRSGTEAALELFDLSDGRKVAHLPTSTTLAHGIAVSADSKYAFVSVEGVGSEPGKVDVFDLANRRQVASIEVGQQATGIAIAP